MVSLSQSLCRCLTAKKQRPNKVAPEFTAIAPLGLDSNHGGSSTSSSRPRQAPRAPPSLPPTAIANGGSAVRVSAPGAPNAGALAQATPPDAGVQPQPAKPLRLEDVAEGNYVVGLKRTQTSERWGLIWDSQIMEKRNVRVVEKVSPNTIAAEWNSQNPGHEIRIGDTLIQVNGKSGRLEFIGMELSRSLDILCEFKPVEPLAKLPATSPLHTSLSSRSTEIEVAIGSESPKREKTPTPVATQKVAPLAPLAPVAPLAPLAPVAPLAPLVLAMPPITSPPHGQAQATIPAAATVTPVLEPVPAVARQAEPPSLLQLLRQSPRDAKQKLLEASAIALPEDLMREKPSALRKMALELGCTEEEIENSDDAATQEERKTILIQAITQVLSLCSTIELPEPEPIPNSASGSPVTLQAEPAAVFKEYGLGEFADKFLAAGIDDSQRLLSSNEAMLQEIGFSPDEQARVIEKLEASPQSFLAKRTAEASGTAHGKVSAIASSERPAVIESQADAVTTSEPEEAPPLDQKQEQEILFLPKEFRGSPIVRNEGGNIFRVDNSHLDSGGRGVAFRYSKNLDDKSSEFAEWGKCLVAVDEYDGWIKVERQVVHDSGIS